MVCVSTLPQSRPLTRADLEALPDDGHRYELIDGALIVTPVPSWRHQAVVLEVAVLLRASAPPHLQVFVAPLDVALSDDTVLQPDVLVARRADLGPRDLPAVPLLAVEVLSPSTRHIDLTLKRSRYDAAGCPAYWAIDPEGPSLSAWERRGDAYQQVADVQGSQSYAATLPYPVVVRPAALVDR